MCCSGVLITGQDWRSYENEVLMKVLDLLAFTEYKGWVRSTMYRYQTGKIVALRNGRN